MVYHITARLYQIHTILMHIHIHLLKLFIDRIVIHINTYNIEFNSFTRNVGVAECRRRSTCSLEAVPSCGFESCRELDFS